MSLCVSVLCGVALCVKLQFQGSLGHHFGTFGEHFGVMWKALGSPWGLMGASLVTALNLIHFMHRILVHVGHHSGA